MDGGAFLLEARLLLVSDRSRIPLREDNMLDDDTSVQVLSRPENPKILDRWEV